MGRVTAILGSRGLSLRQVSLRSAALYGRSSPFFIPHNLYRELQSESFSPSLYQLFAFSRITGYELPDWFDVFGFNLEDVLRFQILLRSKRTVILDSALVDRNAWTPWFRDASKAVSPPPIAPLSQLLEPAGPVPTTSLRHPDRGFLYAKIGTQDALGFPELFPGSIVRVNPRGADNLKTEVTGKASRLLYLIEHSKGVCCSRLCFTGKNRIVAVSTHLGYAQVELKLADEVRLLGTVDMEFRGLLDPVEPEVPKELASRWEPARLRHSDGKLGRLFRHGRQRTGLSFREASALSRTIADLLEDERYFVASGSLSDYEVSERPPRHLQKLITLCSLYGISLAQLLTRAGMDMTQAGKDVMPDRLIFRRRPPSGGSHEWLQSVPASDSGFLSLLLQKYGEPPLILRGSLGVLSGLRTHSLRDFFWIGQNRQPRHPHLEGGLLVIVNRRKKTPLYWPAKPWWQQPLYVVVRRDGEYLCASCSQEDGVLVLHAYRDCSRMPDQVLERGDGEVVGQIVTIARVLE